MVSAIPSLMVAATIWLTKRSVDETDLNYFSADYSDITTLIIPPLI